jgi:hypothetical protein
MTALFTRRAANASGEPLTAVIDVRTVADPADYPELQASGLTACRRDGHLVTAGSHQAVAAVSSVYLPARIPPAAGRLLARTATPLGLALEPFGVWREELRATTGCTRGRLWLPGPDRVVAVAWEMAL